MLKESPYDKSVDLYLFGLLAYELLTGVAAFPSDSGNVEEKILKSDYNIPDHLTQHAKDLISRLVLSQPEKRLTISGIKKHAFFDKLDWERCYQGKLKMPVITLRKVVKSNFPYNFNEESEEEDYFEKKNESSMEDRSPVAGLDLKSDEDIPVMIEVQVSPTNPLDLEEAEERKLEISAGGGFEFDESKREHQIPFTYDH